MSPVKEAERKIDQGRIQTDELSVVEKLPSIVIELFENNLRDEPDRTKKPLETALSSNKAVPSVNCSNCCDLKV
jgi:hypothetical protein